MASVSDVTSSLDRQTKHDREEHVQHRTPLLVLKKAFQLVDGDRSSFHFPFSGGLTRLCSRPVYSDLAQNNSSSSIPAMITVQAAN